MDQAKYPGQLTEGSVDLWIADLRNWRSQTKQLRPLLSNDELKRLERLKIASKKNDFLCSRGLMRIILSRYLTQDPNDLLLEYSPAGKPSLKDPLIQFNISHSRDILICGITLTNQIGIDIQEIYSISNIDRIIKNYFSTEEVQYLSSLQTRENYKEKFFEIWTAKEAYLKAVGSGIRESFNQFSLIPGSAELGRFTLLTPESGDMRGNWTIRLVEVAQGYIAALAYNGTMAEMRRYEIIPEDFFTT